MGKMDVRFADMKNDIVPLITTIIHPKVLTLSYSGHIETLFVIYWNSCVALKCRRQKRIDVSQLHNIMDVMQVNKHIKHSHFIVKACKFIHFLLLLYGQHWFLIIYVALFQYVCSNININLSKERDWSLNQIWHILRRILLWSWVVHRTISTRHLWPNVVNVILPVSGLGSAKVYCKAKFCIFGLNQTIPPHHPRQDLNIFKNTWNCTSHAKIPNLCPQNKIFFTHGQQCS